MKKTVTLLAILTLLTVSLEAGFKSEHEVRQYADSIVEEVSRGEVSAAIELAKEYWPMPTEEMDELSRHTVSQLRQVSNRFGGIIGSEFIDEKKMGGSFLRYRYIVKFENHAIRWVMIFYKPVDEWILNKLNWDDHTDLLFQ